MNRVVVAALVAFQAAAATPPIALKDGEWFRHRLDQPAFIRSVCLPGQCSPIQVQIVVNTQGEVESARSLQNFQQVSAAAESEEKKQRFKPFYRGGDPVPVTFVDEVAVIPPEEPAALRVPFPEIQNWNSLRIKLDRQPCYGPCPAYSVEVLGNGDVFYSGNGGLLLLPGKHRGHITHDSVVRLLEAFRNADYFSLKDKYGGGYDLSTFVTSIEFDGHQKTVTDFAGVSATARKLEDLIDAVTQSDQWVKGSSETAAALLRENWDFTANTNENDQVFAAAITRPEILDLYFQYGFPPMDPPEHGVSPFIYAALYPNPTLLVRLMGNRKSLPPSLLLKALIFASSAGHVDTMRFLIAHGANPRGVDRTMLDGPSPIFAAVRSGKTAAVEEILKYHPDLNAVTRPDGKSLMSVLLTGFGDKEEAASILAALIKAGEKLSPGRQVNKDEDEPEPLLFSLTNVPHPAAVLRVLVQARLDPQAADNSGTTALMECGNAACARALLGSGANVLARNHAGRTALDTADYVADKDLIDVIKNAMKSTSGR
jgi:ankyrin repeat protein